MLLKAAKSRSKTDDPEKEKLKAKAKEIQSLEAERIRHEEANKTALEAIGNLKKRKLNDSSDPSKVTPSAFSLRSRTKRVHVRDLLFLMEQERCLKHSNILKFFEWYGKYVACYFTVYFHRRKLSMLFGSAL